MIKTIFQMVHYLCWLMFSLLILLCFSCTFNSQANNLENDASQESRKAILKVSTMAGDTSYPHGQILNMKLYDNMDVEFDFYFPYSPERVGKKFTTELKKGKISLENYNQIISILNQPDIRLSDNYYAPGKIMSVDSSVKKTVIILSENNEKKIVLEENDSHLHLKNKSGIYPASLIKLLELVERLNLELRKEIDPNSR